MQRLTSLSKVDCRPCISLAESLTPPKRPDTCAQQEDAEELGAWNGRARAPPVHPARAPSAGPVRLDYSPSLPTACLGDQWLHVHPGAFRVLQGTQAEHKQRSRPEKAGEPQRPRDMKRLRVQTFHVVLEQSFQATSRGKVQQ